MAVQLGKRLAVLETDADGQPVVDDDGKQVFVPNSVEVLCIKPGNCNLFLDGKPMGIMQPKVLPSAD